MVLAQAFGSLFKGVDLTLTVYKPSWLLTRYLCSIYRIGGRGDGEGGKSGIPTPVNWVT